jgi:hypothetical protein
MVIERISSFETQPSYIDLGREPIAAVKKPLLWSKDTLESSEVTRKSAIKAEAKSEGYLEAAYNWVCSWFYTPPAISEKVDGTSTSASRPTITSPDEVSRRKGRDRIAALHKEATQRIHDINEEGEEAMRRAPESRNDLEYQIMHALLEQRKLRENESIINHEDHLILQDYYKVIKSKIDELLKNQVDTAKKSKILGGIELGSTFALIATAVAIGALTVATGGAASILFVLQGVAAVTAGGVGVYKGVTDYKGNLDSAQLLGHKEDRKANKDQQKQILDDYSKSNEALNQIWASLRNWLDNLNQAMHNNS